MTLNDYIGTPYKTLDCFALVREVSEKIYGKRLPAIEDYAAAPSEAIEQQKGLASWVELEYPVPGCVVELGQSPTFSKHIGIYIGPSILHTCVRYGCILQDEYQLLSAGYTHIRFFKWEG